MIRSKNLVLLLGMLFLVVCDNTTSVTDIELEEVKAKIVEADNDFSMSLFSEVVASTDESNVFISPLSVSLALGMTLNGANGTTYSEMKETLVLSDLEMDEINQGYQSLMDDLQNADENVQLDIANSVFSNQNFEIEKDFVDRLHEFFEAEARSLDFNDLESVDIINNWVADNTNDRITKIVEELSPHDVMLLINAVYFNGDWKYSFDPESTNKGHFYLNEDEYVEVDFMNQQNLSSYYIDEEIELLELPYGDEMFAMTLIKSKSSDSIEEFINLDLTRENIQNWLEKAISDTVGFFVPKMQMEYEIELDSILSDMGMLSAFSGNADFTSIYAPGNISISSVLHKTFLKMDEVGTEAAGVTVVTITLTSGVGGPSFPVIYFNKPYVMILREKSTGAILFMGKIGDPSLSRHEN